MLILIILFFNASANENNFTYLKEYMPDNLSTNEDIKSFAIKAFKKALLINNENNDIDENVYEIDDLFDSQIKIKTSLLYENLKIKLNTNFANLNMTYIALDNTLNFKIYKDINKDLQISISEEKKLLSSYEQVLFNFIYKF